jgi:hypothetical protein
MINIDRGTRQTRNVSVFAGGGQETFQFLQKKRFSFCKKRFSFCTPIIELGFELGKKRTRVGQARLRALFFEKIKPQKPNPGF